MQISKIVTACFSPTGTTRKILDAIARGMDIAQRKTIDLTLPQDTLKQSIEFNDELVILGAPVYGGRLPGEAVKRLSKLKGKNTPAVVIVLYGNREFEDALLELRDIAVNQGFIPVAGAAFIGEHSYTSPETPIANGRPDSGDIARAEGFGKEIFNKLSSIGPLKDGKFVEVPGNTPYKDAMPLTDDCAKSDMDICTFCSTCVTLCPTGAIADDDTYTTDPNLCILCCACVKGCPEGARYMDSEKIKKASKWLSENCATPKQPLTFI
ncbi:MAG: 4Fe-4S binding protein [Desulfobacteraceae bacterium]|jgi:ferredoxin/flavodoxin